MKVVLVFFKIAPALLSLSLSLSLEQLVIATVYNLCRILRKDLGFFSARSHTPAFLCGQLLLIIPQRDVGGHERLMYYLWTCSSGNGNSGRVNVAGSFIYTECEFSRLYASMIFVTVVFELVSSCFF